MVEANGVVDLNDSLVGECIFDAYDNNSRHQAPTMKQMEANTKGSLSSGSGIGKLGLDDLEDIDDSDEYDHGQYEHDDVGFEDAHNNEGIVGLEALSEQSESGTGRRRKATSFMKKPYVIQTLATLVIFVCYLTLLVVLTSINVVQPGIYLFL